VSHASPQTRLEDRDDEKVIVDLQHDGQPGAESHPPPRMSSIPLQIIVTP
jgi:hypothetical protein